ncbi:hypothetical protein DICPUDRAFT_154393 [Dictyostelium purpureum]|uniref:MRH domain-containing protein n=1 Tax=Dictyostelium purpureum TaxID=5786 RepID=F0ZR84_DICPU|nr:uncharacterized protein DICPUDRAFT_154393 [Dictyostelium purpureum]EGC33553.1 hypothetical protein DICPUDRAFT_154393 [Dictyostelium purpureum]|eukprot:XP_003289935.1 hypothetical protein DICPUDRAFT_154393 [Dictyostelium purpureum]
MKYSNFLLLFFFNFLIIFVFGDCVFNNIDYSHLSNPKGYSAPSALNLHKEEIGKYTFHWNICGSCSKCSPLSGSACQRNDGRNEIIGEASRHLWGIEQSSGKTTLTYFSKNGHGCPDKPRQLTIIFVCTNEPLKTSLVYEDSECKYSVTMYGACGRAIN